MRFYLDTSVFGGYYDDEFEQDTKSLFSYILKKNIPIIYSDINAEEILKAPDDIKNLLAMIETVERIKVNEEIKTLAKLYIKEGALREKDFNDAQHIATATIASASVLISWNFKHMVNFLKIKQYNSINIREGYQMINIYSPKEINEDYED